MRGAVAVAVAVTEEDRQGVRASCIAMKLAKMSYPDFSVRVKTGSPRFDAKQV
jgi:hypothetical protein